MVTLFPSSTVVEKNHMILGKKGLSLIEMSEMGLPVPPGIILHTTFTTSTPSDKDIETLIQTEIKFLELQTGKVFGDINNPLVVSVRSGAPVSMPGMMDTILNVGITKNTKNVPFDSYEKLMDLFVNKYNVLKEKIETPYGQLVESVKLVIKSYYSERAVLYRENNKISHDVSTAINIQKMVFGNLNEKSFSGVVFSRDINTGEKGITGEYILKEQGEALVGGTRTPLNITELKETHKNIFNKLTKYMKQLELYYQDVMEAEFTVENGKLWLLQCRPAILSKPAISKFAKMQFKKKINNWTELQTLNYCKHKGYFKFKNNYELSLKEREELKNKYKYIAGIGNGCGVVVGEAYFNSPISIIKKHKKNNISNMIYATYDTTTEDLPLFSIVDGMITKHGGFSCHAAIVSKQMNTPAVVGITNLSQIFDPYAYKQKFNIILDSNNGEIYYSEQIDPMMNTYGNTINNSKDIIYLDKIFNKIGIYDKHVINFELIKNTWSLESLILNFYIATIIEDNEVIEKVADILGCYLFLAVAGEVRHLWHNKAITEEDKKIINLLEVKYELKLNSELGRQIAQETVYSIENLNVNNFLETVKYAYSRPLWKKGFGGHTWKTITQHLIDWVNGRITNIVFVDYTFDLQHNNGTVFGKHAIIGKLGFSYNILNEKKHNVDKKLLLNSLIKYFSERRLYYNQEDHYLHYMSNNIKELVEPQILRDKTKKQLDRLHREINCLMETEDLTIKQSQEKIVSICSKYSSVIEKDLLDKIISETLSKPSSFPKDLIKKAFLISTEDNFPSKLQTVENNVIQPVEVDNNTTTEGLLNVEISQQNLEPCRQD